MLILRLRNALQQLLYPELPSVSKIERFACSYCKKLQPHPISNAYWIRITCSAGGKLAQSPLCEQCAYRISKALD